MSQVWRHVVGLAPFTVTAEERPAKGHVVYLRWWDASTSNWRWRSTGVALRELTGRNRAGAERHVLQLAEQQYELLAGKRTADAPAKAPLTLGETWARLADRERGKYPHDTAHRQEVERALRDACRLMGKSLPWTLMDRAAFRALGRKRLEEVRAAKGGTGGLRAAEIVVARLLAVGAWLRDEGHIPDHAGFAASTWKTELHEFAAQLPGGAPDPHRPRYTRDEMNRLLDAGWAVDPRAGLLFELGHGLRPGQVVRSRRSDLDRERGILTVRGRGKKRGTVVVLTKAQQRAVARALTGYLAPLEGTVPDYFLFPAGKLRKGQCTPAHATRPHVDRTAWRKWWAKIEEQAKVPHVAGRGPYGVKRAAVDAAKATGISREGLKALGGWADTQIPDRIYAEQEQLYAAEEAAKVREQIRGGDA